MNLLLDTHAVIWFVTGDLRLPRRTKALIEDTDSRCFVSCDPFDRIIIAQSIDENLLVVTKDDKFEHYDAYTTWRK